MAATADILRRLSALDIPAAAMREVMSIIADMDSANQERKKRDRERKRKDNSAENPRKETGNSAEIPAKIQAVSAENPSSCERARAFNTGEEVDISLEDLSSKGASAPSDDDLLAAIEKPITPSAMLYKRAREIGGDKAAPFVTKLMRQNGGDIGATRQMVEQAAVADRPIAYLAGIVAAGERRPSPRASPDADAPMTVRTRALQRIFNEPDCQSQIDAERTETPAAYAGNGAHARLVGAR